MKRDRFRTGKDMWSRWAVAALILGAAVPLPVLGAERMVLCEEFTSTFCLGCPYASNALARLLGDYPDTLAFVQFHYGDAYDTVWGMDRLDLFYHPGDLPTLPTTYFDGVDEYEDSLYDVDLDYAVFLAAYNARRAAPTDVTINLTGESPNAYVVEATANVCVEAAGSAKTMRVYMVQVLDNWPMHADVNYRHGFKQEDGTTDITLNPGECETVAKTFALDANSVDNAANVKIIAWAQEPQDVGAPADRAEVFQAASLRIIPNIPAVSEWGLIMMALLGLTAGTVLFMRRRPTGA